MSFTYALQTYNTCISLYVVFKLQFRTACAVFIYVLHANNESVVTTFRSVIPLVSLSSSDINKVSDFKLVKD